MTHRVLATIVLLTSCTAPWLVRIDDVGPGDDCTAGGAAIHAGPDEDGDGTLSDAEITETEYVCDAVSTLVRTTDEPPGANCAAGGLAVEVGADLNGDGVLDDTEVEQTYYTCNGEDGVSTLVRVDAEPPGDNCSEGGIAVNAGADEDGDLMLDDEEIEATRYVCNGADGGGGLDLTTVEGDYTIENSLDVALLGGVTTVTGEVRAPADVLTEIVLQELEHMGGLRLSLESHASSCRLERLELESLQTVESWDHTVSMMSIMCVDRLVLSELSAVSRFYLNGTSVSTLDTVAALRTVDGDFAITSNPDLTDVSGAEGIVSITGDLGIANNDSLPTCAAEALRDAIGTENIGGTVNISGNDDQGTCP